MSVPYYTGDGVPLKFTVSDADGVVNPSSGLVYILKPGNEYLNSVVPAIDGNEISYNVPGSITNKPGLYRVYFVLILPSGFERTHKIEFKVIVNPEENR